MTIHCHLLPLGYSRVVPEINVKLETDLLKNEINRIQPIFILCCVLAETIFICEHFDPSVDAGSRYYREYEDDSYIERVYGSNATKLNDEILHPITNSSCIGGSPGKNLDQCKFDGYLNYDELCNPCKVKEFKEQCEELCEMTTGPEFGPFGLM